MPDRPDGNASGSLNKDWDLLRRVNDEFIQLAEILGIILVSGFRERARQLDTIMESLRASKAGLPPSWYELLSRLYADKSFQQLISSRRGRGVYRDANTEDDVRSETLLEVWLAIIRNSGRWFRGRGRNESWWFRVWGCEPTQASRAARRIQGPPKLRPTGQSDDDGPLTPPEQTLDSGDLPPDVQADCREFWDRVCAGLPAEEREVLAFRGERKSNKKIASELGIDPDIVKKRVQSGRRKLRKKLQGKLAQLAPADSRMIDLFFFQRKSIAQLARLLDISIEEAQLRLRQAIRRFRELLDP